MDEETARRAINLIKLKVREAACLLQAADARADNAVLLHDNKRGNIEREVHNEFGDTAAGFANADLVREDTYEYCRGAPRHDGAQCRAGSLGHRAWPPDAVVRDPGSVPCT